jgi:hypothetical protein
LLSGNCSQQLSRKTIAVTAALRKIHKQRYHDVEEAAESAASIAELNALLEHCFDLIVLFEEERTVEKVEKGKILYNMWLTDSVQISQFTCPSALSAWGWQTDVFRDYYGKVGCDSTHKFPTQHNGRTSSIKLNAKSSIP